MGDFLKYFFSIAIFMDISSKSIKEHQFLRISFEGLQWRTYNKIKKKKIIRIVSIFQSHHC